MTWQASGYRHRQELGGGRTGRAWLAVEESTGELVVIKYLNIEETYYSDVRAEIERVSALDAAYYVRIRRFVQEEQGVAIVMDPVNGTQLRMLIRDHGALAGEASLLLYRDSLTALAAASAAGMVHGDYRPENVIVDATGKTRLLDVRMAAWIHRDVTLSTGVYLAPERWHAAELTAAADVYAATIVFFELVVGEPPYWEESQLLALRYAHESGDIPVAALPDGLRDLVRLGLAKDVSERLDAAGLLMLIEGIGVAEFGADWEATGRAQLAERVGLLALPIGDDDSVAAMAFVRDTEDESNDDFYAVGAVAGAAAVGVLAAGAVAADTVEVTEFGAVGVEAVGAGAVGVEAVGVEVSEVGAVGAGAVGVAGAAVEELSTEDAIAIQVAEAEAIELAQAEMVAEAVAAAEAEREREALAVAAAEAIVLAEAEAAAVAEAAAAVEVDEVSVGAGAVGVGGVVEEEDDDATGAFPLVAAGGLLAAVALGGDDTGAIAIGADASVGEAGAVGVGAAPVPAVGKASPVAVGKASPVAVGAAGAVGAGAAGAVTVGVAGSVGVGEAPVPPIGRHKAPEDKDKGWFARNLLWVILMILLLLLLLCGVIGIMYTKDKGTKPGGPGTVPGSTAPGQVGCPSTPCATGGTSTVSPSPSDTNPGGPGVSPSPSPTDTPTPTPTVTPSKSPKPTPIPVPTDTHNPCGNPHPRHSGHDGAAGAGQPLGSASSGIGFIQLRC